MSEKKEAENKKIYDKKWIKKNKEIYNERRRLDRLNKNRPSEERLLPNYRPLKKPAKIIKAEPKVIPHSCSSDSSGLRIYDSNDLKDIQKMIDNQPLTNIGEDDMEETMIGGRPNSAEIIDNLLCRKRSKHEVEKELEDLEELERKRHLDD